MKYIINFETKKLNAKELNYIGTHGQEWSQEWTENGQVCEYILNSKKDFDYIAKSNKTVIGYRFNAKDYE